MKTLHTIIKIASASLLAVFLLALPQSVAAIESSGIGGYPAHPDPDVPESVDWFIYELEPGDSLHDEVVVVNNTLEPKTIEIYPADQTPSAGGGIALKQKVEPMTEVGSWIIVETKQVDLDPGEFAVIPFSVQLPQDITAGDYVGGIVIQEVKPPELTGGIALSTRMAVRMYVTVPGDIHEAITFLGITNKSVSKFKTYKTWQDLFSSYDVITISLKNDGNVNHRVVADIVVENMFGGLVEEFLDLNFQVLKQSTYDWNSTWKTPWFGGIYKISADLSIETRKDNFIVNDHIWVWIWPEWWVLITIVLIIILIAWIKIGGYSISINRSKGNPSTEKTKKTNTSKNPTHKASTRKTSTKKKSSRPSSKTRKPKRT